MESYLSFSRTQTHSGARTHSWSHTSGRIWDPWSRDTNSDMEEHARHLSPIAMTINSHLPGRPLAARSTLVLLLLSLSSLLVLLVLVHPNVPGLGVVPALPVGTVHHATALAAVRYTASVSYCVSFLLPRSGCSCSDVRSASIGLKLSTLQPKENGQPYIFDASPISFRYL
jgi:hypothetical protein